MRLLPALAFGTLLLPLAAYANDPNSYAQPDQVRVTHLDLDLTIDFPRKQLDGQATLKLDWKNPRAQSLVLDTRDLKIAKIEALGSDGKATPLTYALAPRDKVLGSKLTIATPKHPAQVRIVYTTSPEASGLQWLTPAQTADKKLPFMFSQSESIHARSWVPLQDSPAIRFTYDARVTAPQDVRVAMSAINDAKHPLDGKFAFRQPHPIPSYLLAISAGDLAVKETGPRSAVYAEPSVVGKAAHEFEDTEKLIAATEQLYGPYAWGRYDILVLPPSFPFGGMENPNMTFATPTVLVGDKSLVSLVSHELAHSWSGNLVTSAAWRDIWLNEGFTTYVQGRITEAVYGKALADEEALLSARALQKSIGTMAANAQKLAPDPRGIGADDALSDVAYDKGSWFLRTLEQRFGRDHFDAYLKGYFHHFAFQSITTEQMLDYMKPNLIEKYPGKMSWDEVKAWVYGEGIPKDAPLPDSPRFNAIDRERTDFLAGKLAADKLDAKGWNTQEWMYFLDRLPDVAPLDKLRQLDAAWRLTGTPNAEIGMRWYSHAIAAGDKSVWTAAAEHMTRIGRIYLTTPLYKAFVKTPEGLSYAEQVYAKAKAGYHPLTQQVVEGIIAKAKSKKN
ncbi:MULTISPECIES: M1 family metallopeptidase [unclassified Rhodanobacter]|uniref:M1 family metallopeptidase n=1 Tax=unclassified Rhodanobacter TaxID=2621553 RepID=UPI001BDE4C92|nr:MULTISPECIES: M1 family metallopeptidase [unclassified Rhodanobacter]MBT2143811.1 leukotriene A4 hydrolase C-terminal domain-containing protein [Rhodanobacter sp. LX-99]MBT2147115.1 leukotriene A4 hydrolase C-terminal domain-containing protein [Rhodanobacter sp. LX-100]